MKAIIPLILALVPAFTWAALCDDTYYLQSVTQTTISGSDPKAMNNRQVKNVKPDLSDLAVLHNLMTYNVMVGFDGSCTKALKPVRYKYKAASRTGFVDSIDTGYQIQMFDTTVSIQGLGYKLDYWFGFYKPETSLKFFVGRLNSEGELFTNYYAAVIYTDSTKDAQSGLWSTSTTHFYSLSGPSDSVSLDNGMLDGTGVRDIVVNDNHKGYFSIQFLKVSYGNQAPSALAPLKRSTSKFQTSQMGGLVLIQTGEKNGTLSEPLSLYGMMGNKVATLHPTGYMYQWNGKTSAGADASTGVYFVQAGNRVLGKFFYSR